jgi:hypothetical protein
MNTLKLIFKQTKTKPFYNIILRHKYRRDPQPGYTRYNYDELTYDEAPYEVINFNIRDPV